MYGGAADVFDGDQFGTGPNVAEFDGPAQTKPSATFTVPCVNSYTVTNGNDAGEGSLRLGIAGVCDGSTISFNGDTSIYLASELGINREITNVNGSGCGLGHPVGATGCRIMVTLIHAMKKRGNTLGLATLCGGGGVSMATALEMI